jgi:hypothetical protein
VRVFAGGIRATRHIAATTVAVLATAGGFVTVNAQVVHGASPSSQTISFTSAHPLATNGKGTGPRGIIPHVVRGQRPKANAAGGKLSTNPACPGCNPPLLFSQGNQRPVMGGLSGLPGHVTITPIYWAPIGYTYTTTYKTIVNGYVANVAAASGLSTNVFSMSTEYYQEATGAGAPLKHIHYVVAAGAAIDDNHAYPPQGLPNGCNADATYSACVTDIGLQAELQAFLPAHSLTKDDSHVYMVLFPQHVETCLQPGTASMTVQCSTNAYCAYHSSTAVSSTGIIYGNEPFPVLNICSDPWNGPQAPNGDTFADAELSPFSHEANESITDWAGAWFDAAGYENGDQCAYVYGTPVGSTGVPVPDGQSTGTAYNQVIGSGKYYTQDEFSNRQFALGVGDPPAPGVQGLYGTISGCLQGSILPGLLRVTTSPAVASQITVDGNIADSWGLNWLKAQPGSHTVCFTPREGFITPACQTVAVSSSATTTVTGTFVQRGFLHVFTSPALPSTISIDGIPRDDWGVFTDLATGSHQVCFGLVKDFTPPTCQTAVVTSGATTNITGTFTSSPGASGQTNVGLLRVVTSPAVASQITVDGNIADTWGLNWLEIAPGSHTVCFTPREGFTTPACQTVAVTAGSTTAATGTFVQRGFLHVFTSPASPGTVLISGIPADDWGLYTDLPVSTYQVCFDQIASLANTPACQSAVVTAGSTTNITGTYS